MHRVRGNRRSAAGPLGIAAGLVCFALLATPLVKDARAESRVTLIPASGPAGSQVSLAGRDLGKRDPVVVRVGKQVRREDPNQSPRIVQGRLRDPPSRTRQGGESSRTAGAGES